MKHKLIGATTIIGLSLIFLAGHAAQAAANKTFRALATIPPTTITNEARVMVQSGNFIYAVDLDNLLVLPSSPTNASVIKTIPLVNGGNDLTVSNGYLYVALPGSGIKIYTLADPADPILVSSIGAYGGGWSVKVVGSYAYVTHTLDGRFVVYNVSNPAVPTVVGNVDMGKQVYGFSISGTHAYVATVSGLAVIDISVPTNPTVVASLATSGFSYDVTVVGDYAYVADQSLWIVNIANPVNPLTVGRYTGVQGWRVHSIGTVPGYYGSARTFIGVAAADKGVYIFDVTKPSRPTLRGAWPVTHSAYDILFNGNTMVVGAGRAGFIYFDIQRVLEFPVVNFPVTNSVITITRPSGTIVKILPFRAGQVMKAYTITTCDTSDGCTYYLAALLNPLKPVSLKLYTVGGRLISTTAPFTSATNGANIRFYHSQSYDKVFLVIGPKAGQSTAKVYLVGSTGLQYIQTLTTAPAGKAGVTIIADAQVYIDRDARLMTGLAGSTIAPKFWKFDGLKFVEDTNSALKNLVSIVGSRIVLK